MFNSPENFDDFQNWPIDQGAPWVDVDGDGEYNPLPSGVDHPKFYGDIVAFFVSADDEPGDKLAMNPATDPTKLNFKQRYLHLIVQAFQIITMWYFIEHY